MKIEFQDCLAGYHKHGISFQYPDFWEMSEQTDGTDILVTVAADDTCFWMIRILPGCPPPPQVVESCLEAFREEYEEVDVSESDVTLAEMPAYARDVDFYCMELMNSAKFRCVRTTDFTLLAWWQGTFHELEQRQPILEHMMNSVRADRVIG